MDIARSDWPHFFPDFYINILELIHARDTMALGLNMLLIASEELATPREDLPAQRKEELSKLLGAQVPQVRESPVMRIHGPQRYDIDVEYHPLWNLFGLSCNESM